MTVDKDLKVKGLVDRMIYRLLNDQNVDGFSDEELGLVLDKALEIMKPLPTMVEMNAPLVIFGDLHGQFGDLLRFLKLVGHVPQTRMLFLGDYVDRCKNSLEVTMLLLCFKLKHPTEIELLRGNHECAKMNRCYGFYEEVRRKRNINMWKRLQNVFNELPLCAKINDRIFACHGGLSPDIKNWDSLKNLQKPRTNSECEHGIPLDLMWADPSQDSCTVGWQHNKVRNASYMFGNDVIKDFCQLLDIDLIVRAHEAIREGHSFAGENNQLCTIFSAPNYCGVDLNNASVMKVSNKLEVSFVTLKPRLDINKLSTETRIELDKIAMTANVKSPLPGGSNDSKEAESQEATPQVKEDGKTDSTATGTSTA